MLACSQSSTYQGHGFWQRLQRRPCPQHLWPQPQTLHTAIKTTTRLSYQPTRDKKRKNDAVRQFYIKKLEVYPTLPCGRRAILDDEASVGVGGGITLGPYVLSRGFLLFDSFHFLVKFGL